MNNFNHIQTLQKQILVRGVVIDIFPAKQCQMKMETILCTLLTALIIIFGTTTRALL